MNAAQEQQPPSLEQPQKAQATGVHIDRVTQLQDSIDQLGLMLVSSLDYLHKKAGMVQVDPSIPVTQKNIMADDADAFSARTKEIATDICRQAKKIDVLIEALPGIDASDSEQKREFDRLNEENQKATEELEAANRRAEELLDQVKAILQAIAENSGKVAGLGA